MGNDSLLGKSRFPLGEIVNSTFKAISGNYYLHNGLNIDESDLSVLYLILLHHNGLISAKQLSLYCNRHLKDNKILNRKIKLYHSKINDRWYEDETFTSILSDICFGKKAILKYNISMEEMLKYLNVGFSRNRNWCVDYIAFSYIKPLIDYYDKDKSYPILKAFGLDVDFMTYEEADSRYDLASGYCCSDCDGCRGEYKRSQYNYYYKKNPRDTYDVFKKALLELKSHNKNPNDKVMLEFNESSSRSRGWW